jgi:hypothetical protein
MNIWMTSDLNHQFLTVGITACQEEWKLIGNSIFQGKVFIETNWRSEIMEKSNNSNIIKEDLKYLKVLLDESSESPEFMILIDDSMLIIQGSIESLSTLKDLADDFGKDDASDQHVHLSYLDHEDSDCNWFSNKNTELILAVKSKF